jgi:Ca2+-binding RTX toxin-like protein
MALIRAQQGIDSLSIDLNFYSRHFYDDEFDNNVGYRYGGQTYEDVYFINGYNGSTDLVIAFLGYGFGFNSAGRADRGTVTALGEVTYSEEAYTGQEIWSIQNISASASRLNSVALTASNADDRALMSSVMSGNDTIQLSAFDDRFEGWGGNDLMFGGGGNDTLLGGSGTDTIQGGAGHDRLGGGVGRDHMIGGRGNDVYIVTAGDSTAEDANGGIDRVHSAINWNLSANIENLTFAGTAHLGGKGNSLANTMNGNAGSNALNGGAGNDRMFGNAGNDRLLGGIGNDMLKGGVGADTLIGGAGKDTMYGGAGASHDVFVFKSAMESRVGAQRDQIFDFQLGRDDIHLSGIDANKQRAGNQAFDFSGTAADDYSVWFAKQAGGVIVRGDINGDQTADFAIWMDGATRLSENDFLL